jgi:hypothetical protein
MNARGSIPLNREARPEKLSLSFINIRSYGRSKLGGNSGHSRNAILHCKLLAVASIRALPL